MTDKKVKVRSDPLIDGLNTINDKQLMEQLRDKQTKEFDNLVGKYNEIQEKLDGAETHNGYLQEQINELKTAIKLLQEARPMIQATTANEKSAIAMTDEGRRNPNRGYWIRFDLSNLELTRPLINIVMRMKDRPKEFFVEVLGEDVVEVSETKL